MERRQENKPIFVIKSTKIYFGEKFSKTDKRKMVGISVFGKKKDLFRFHLLFFMLKR